RAPRGQADVQRPGQGQGEAEAHQGRPQGAGARQEGPAHGEAGLHGRRQDDLHEDAEGDAQEEEASLSTADQNAPAGGGPPGGRTAQRAASCSRCASTMLASVARAVCFGRQRSSFLARAVFIRTGFRTEWIQATCSGISGRRVATSAVASTSGRGTGTEYQPSASARSPIVSRPLAARL